MAGALSSDRTIREALLDDDPRRKDRSAVEGDANLSDFEFVRLIEEGGFGEVYLAKQLRPLRRDVALKMLKAGVDSIEAITRFEVERQALARMRHPHIPSIFSAGESRDGRPYFAMEYISGPPITCFVKEHPLPFANMLGMLVRVCRAVQHAHQNGVIHRDLKPANILVSEDADGPRPMVIDFGIAKANESEGTLVDEALKTRDFQILGTLRYMGPEQAQINGREVDTRSDIYSLGVVLYELLTDVTPLDQAINKKTKGSTLIHALDAMRDLSPEKPSVVVKKGNRVGMLAQRYQVTPQRYLQILRDELDWIILKALETDPDRRYATADALAEDLDCHLHHRPIKARPPTLVYRARKFSQRHRAEVYGVAAALVMLLTAAWVFHHFQRAETLQHLESKVETVDADSLALLAREVEPYLGELAPRLESRTRAPYEPHQRLIARVLLLPYDRQHLDRIRDWLLSGSSLGLGDMELFRNVLRILKERRLGRDVSGEALVRLNAESRPGAEEGLRLAGILAVLDEKAFGGHGIPERVANWLTESDPHSSGRWAEIFRGVRDQLVPRLENVAKTAVKPIQQNNATYLVTIYVDADRPSVQRLVRLTRRATPDQLTLLVRRLKEDMHPFAVEELVRQVRNDCNADESTEDDLVEESGRLLMALCTLEGLKASAPFLRDDGNPGLGSWFIDGLIDYGFSAELVVEVLEKEALPDAARRWLLRALAHDGFTDGVEILRHRLSPLLDAAHRHADPGIHATAELLASKWKFEIGEGLKDAEGGGQARWRVDQEGHTMVTIEVPECDGGGTRLPKLFEMSSKEVTLAQFDRCRFAWEGGPPFDEDAGLKRRRAMSRLEEGVPRDELPVNVVPATEAMRYCNWLSKVCAPDQGDDAFSYEAGGDGEFRPKEGYRRLPGYRLPTRAEFEYACRAGAETRRCFGNDDRLLGHYAWYDANAERTLRRSGLKLPNRFGLFDMLGNLAELCHGDVASTEYFRLGGDLSLDADSMHCGAGNGPLHETIVEGGQILITFRVVKTVHY